MFSTKVQIFEINKHDCPTLFRTIGIKYLDDIINRTLNWHNYIIIYHMGFKKTPDNF